MPKHVVAAIFAALVLIAFPLNAALPQAAATAQEAKSKTTLLTGFKAWRERQRACRTEWKQAKAAGKIEKNQTWPKFLSECNKRLKAAS